ncbi:MAG: META domain-containing protein [Pyrinomonadaceae bacterium]
MKNKIVSILIGAFIASFMFTGLVAAQYKWLDQKPLPSWSERSREILQTKKISKSELKRCGMVVRPATLAADKLLAKQGWTLVGDAQIFGKATAVTVATGFDGMCRPLGYQTLVFVGNSVAGTLSPGPMDSRTDSSLTNVKLVSETSLVADYVRYKDGDALCCPSKTNSVTFRIDADGKNWLLKPDFVSELVYNSNVEKPSESQALAGTIWRMESLENVQGSTKVGKPENYQIEFSATGDMGVKADCNVGGGRYVAGAGNLSIMNIITSMAFCGEDSFDKRMLQSLESAKSYRIEGNSLTIKSGSDKETLKAFRVHRQN